MAKLKLGAIANDKSVKLTVELPAAVHRDLLAYAEVLARARCALVCLSPTRAGGLRCCSFSL